MRTVEVCEASAVAKIKLPLAEKYKKGDIIPDQRGMLFFVAFVTVTTTRSSTKAHNLAAVVKRPAGCAGVRGGFGSDNET